jgi:hypothetical protein
VDLIKSLGNQSDLKDSLFVLALVFPEFDVDAGIPLGVYIILRSAQSFGELPCRSTHDAWQAEHDAVRRTGFFKPAHSRTFFL